MNKGELVDAIASKANVTKKAADEILAATIEVITEAVAKGEKVSLVGFGSFELRHRKGRTGRNPKTGEEIQIAATNVPGFSPGKAFKEAV